MSIALAAGTLCLTLMTSVTTTIEPEKVDLEYTFKSGEPMRYTLTNQSSMMQMMGGQAQSMSESTVSDIVRQRVETMDDGSLVMRQTTTSFTLTESGPGVDFSFDSKSEDDADKRTDPRVDALYKSLNWDTDYVITPQGEVTGVKNLDELQEKVNKIEPEDLREALQDSFSEMTLIREVNPFMHLLPDTPVGEGDTWVKTFSVEDGEMTMSATQNMKVESVLEWKDGHYARVSFEGDLGINLPETFPPFLKVTEHTISGYFIFNTHYGTVSEYNGTLHFKVAGSPGEGMGNMVMTMDMKMAYEFKND